LHCWGWNSYGQLGIGSTIDAFVPAQVSGIDADVTTMTSGANHTCALIDSRLHCWGWNQYGQLGDGSTVNRSVPVPVQFP
jgi:alpha-tubulin suppressor-like RCC1 family protein